MPVHSHHTASPERVVLFGSEGGFSQPVLARLLAHGVTITAVVMPGVTVADNAGGQILIDVQQALNMNSLAGLAAAHDVPVLRIEDIHGQQLLTELSALTVDLLLLACFPLKLPQTIWSLPGQACWNLHPSLLPKYRGPAPLFWQRHNKEPDTGVSLHEVTAQVDGGDIIAQCARALPDCVDSAELDEWVADIGVDLFLEAMQQYRKGDLKSRPQDEALASYYPFPATIIK